MFLNFIRSFKNIVESGVRWLFFKNSFLFKSQANKDYYDLYNSLSIAPSMQGYYMLELYLPTGSPLGLYTFSTDMGDFMVPVKSSGCLKRVCFFGGGVNKLTLIIKDRDDQKLDFKGAGVTFKKLTKKVAAEKMSKKMRSKSNKKISINKTIEKDLYEIYSNLFAKLYLNTSYKAWCSSVEPDLWADIVHPQTTTISIVVPTYNAKPAWLDACFQSVLDQTYSSWQLIIVDDASSDSASIECLKKWQDKHDDRISVVFRESNGHICNATNTGLEIVTGNYICFLDHDDALAPQALNELATSITENPDAKIIYSDEDLMSESGERITPHFKSDWNPELLLAHNYITHLCCYKSDLIKQLDGMRQGLDGAQDYDLILRASRIAKPEHIIHISKILYHWRMVEGSTAMSSGAKSYATQAGLKALQDHMTHINPAANVVHSDRDNFYKVNWPLESVQNTQPKVSVIVPTRDGLEVLMPCIEGLINNTNYKNLEVVILDNGSQETATLDYFKQLSQYPFIKIVRDDGPFNYSALNNHAVQVSSGDLICLLNNDIEIIHDDWLSEMVSLAIRPEVGCVGAKLLYPDDTIQHAGVIMGLGGYAAHSHRGTGRHESGYFCRAQVRQNLSAVTAACLVVRREVFEKVNGLDEEFEVAYNDVDFCLRVQAAGYQNIYTPYAELYHHESKTRGSDDTKSKQKRFDKEKALLLERWLDVIKHDPFYNPNLTRAREDFSIGCA